MRLFVGPLRYAASLMLSLTLSGYAADTLIPTGAIWKSSTPELTREPIGANPAAHFPFVIDDLARAVRTFETIRASTSRVWVESPRRS